MLLEHNRNYGLGIYAGHRMFFGTRAESGFGHGCPGHRLLLEHEKNHGLGMDALVTVCSWNAEFCLWMLS